MHTILDPTLCVKVTISCTQRSGVAVARQPHLYSLFGGVVLLTEAVGCFLEHLHHVLFLVQL